MADFVRRESRNHVAPILACGWFASTYSLTGNWFDIARVDSLFLFLVLASLWLARFGRSFSSAIGAGLTLLLAFFTKQTGLFFLAPVIAFCFVHGWKRAAVASASFIVPSLVGVALPIV